VLGVWRILLSHPTGGFQKAIRHLELTSARSDLARAQLSHGLIYVVDVRNGLNVLRYTGRHAKEVKQVGFLEGNSNLGDALRIAKSAG